MPKLATHTTVTLQPNAILVVSHRPRPGLGRILPSLEALGVPAVSMLAGQIGDGLPPPFHLAPHRVAVLAIDAESVHVAWRAGAGLVAALGSGNHGAAQLAAGAELLLEAPSQIGSGSLLDAYARKFRDLPSAVPRLAALAGAPAALLFDLDGTLQPVPDQPAGGWLPRPIRGLLKSLATRHPLAIISGRAVDDLSRRLALPSAYLAGNHGLELRGADYDPVSLNLAAGWRPLLDAVHERLASLSSEYPDCVVEHKGATLAVHYRALAPASAVAVRRRVVRTVAGFDGVLVDGGDQVLEIRPAVAGDKGTAVEWLLQRMQRSVGPCTAVFFGDGAGDEAAFRAVRRVGGLGVLVAPAGRPTAATCRLDSPRSLMAALMPLLA